MPNSLPARDAVAQMRTAGEGKYVNLGPTVSTPRSSRFDTSAPHHQARSDFEGTSMTPRPTYVDDRAHSHSTPAAIHGSRTFTNGLNSSGRLGHVKNAPL